MRFGLVFVFMLAIGAAPSDAVARGELPYRLPEMRETPPRTAVVIHNPIWHSTVDSPSSTGSMLAMGDGIISFAQHDRVCGFNETNGRRLWCASLGSAPAYSRGVIAYTAEDGRVVAVDARTGARRWRYEFRTSRAVAAFRMPPERVAETVVSTGNSFLLARIDNRGGRGAPDFGEISESGRVLWSAELLGGFAAPLIVQPYALQPLTEAGATINVIQQIVRLGPHGGLREIVGDQAWRVLDVRIPYAVIAGDWTMEEVQDRFLTIDVERVDLRDGRILGQYHYEPDYDANVALYKTNAFAGQGEYTDFPPRLRADGDWLYVALANKLYRYRLAAAERQRPLLVAAKATFLGGPSRGVVFVNRADGVWALTPADRAIHARRVAPSRSIASVFTIVGHTAYIGFEDGHLSAVDVDSGRTTLDAKVSCSPRRLAISLRRFYVVCQSSFGSLLTAFQRPGQ
jgi:outer membrane protein assembly factor BamB